ncbi:MAG: 6-hydroxymethylpterin diphosphokinase MptE-like protein [Thermoplasmatota archaeon]
MDPVYWMPYYEAIARDLGLDPEKDAASARMLSSLLSSNSRVHPFDETQLELERLITGREVFVLGAGPDLEMELDSLIPEMHSNGRWKGAGTGKDVLITADGATSVLLSRGYIPHIVVTDMDGGIEDQLMCLSKGSVMLLHAHGDNPRRLGEVSRRLHGSVLGTTQVLPSDSGDLSNFGGFTDGDRGVFLAGHFGARSIMLLGFDFNDVAPKIGDGGTRGESLDPVENEFKFKKLAWANILLGIVPGPEIRFYSDRAPF